MSKTLSAKYCKKNKERLQKKTVKNIKIYLKNKKNQYGPERYKNLSKNEKQKLIERRKKYYRMRKNALLQTP